MGKGEWKEMSLVLSFRFVCFQKWVSEYKYLELGADQLLLVASFVKCALGDLCFAVLSEPFLFSFFLTLIFTFLLYALLFLNVFCVKCPFGGLCLCTRCRLGSLLGRLPPIHGHIRTQCSTMEWTVDTRRPQTQPVLTSQQFGNTRFNFFLSKLWRLKALQKGANYKDLPKCLCYKVNTRS